MSNEDRLKEFVEEIARIRGVNYVAAGTEGLPYLIKGTEKENAEYISAVASSLYKKIDDLVVLLDLGKEEWSKIYLPEDYRLHFFQYKDKVVAIKYESYIEPVLNKLIDNLIHNVVLKCPHCGKDLSFVTVKCPSCGSLNVFNEPKCWSCGYDLRLKECPYCGKPVFYDGKKPGFFTLLIFRLKKIFGG